MGIRFENLEIYGWEAAIRGMRNPKNSWEKSDSNCKTIIKDGEKYIADFIGENDLKLMNALFKAGSDHRKFTRFITVTVDIIAPLYWWKEFDTYKVGTVANSCSTMHKIAAKEFTIDDFSHEHLELNFNRVCLENTIHCLNVARKNYLETGEKRFWWNMIQLLPSSYNQRRTIQMNYEVLANMNRTGRRKDHKLDEWRTFCEWVDCLPYYAEITKCS